MLAEANESLSLPLNRAVALASQRAEQASMLIASSSLFLFFLGVLTPWVIGSVPVETRQTLCAMLLVAGPVALTLGIISVYLRDLGSVPVTTKRERLVFAIALAACAVSMLAFFALTQAVWIAGFF